jgi:hypothetical protein
LTAGTEETKESAADVFGRWARAQEDSFVDVLLAVLQSPVAGLRLAALDAIMVGVALNFVL